MHCNELANKVDNFLDGEIASSERQMLEQHARSCKACTSLLEHRASLRQALADLPVEGPSESFFDDALDRAHVRRQSNARPWFVKMPSAIAAAAAVILATAITLQSSFFASGDIPQVDITMHEVTPVNLQIASQTRLTDARLTLQLPEGVELAGFTGRKQLSWRTDLKEGNNVLELPLLGYVASTDRLIAELEHPQGSKTFELQITVN
jgi:hypothetical protein